MRKFMLAASALALAFGSTAMAVAQGRGGGGGGGGGGQQAERGHRGGGGGGQRAERGHRGGQQAERGNRGGGQRAERGPRPRQERVAQRATEDRGPRRMERGNEDRGPRGNGRRDVVVERAERRADNGPRRERRGERLTQRRAVAVANPDDVVQLRWDRDAAIGRGCPPGLARKYNGCMPPGQVRQAAREQGWFNNWWPYPAASNYVYDDGFLYSLGGDGRIASYLPLAGGALWPGTAWPNDYRTYSVDPYHRDYYGLDEGLDYRFGDGAIFGVDPTSQMIQTVAALIAGDDWTVGRAMPAGYDLYNVPYDYRDQYADTNDAWYRYSDGYVYQVDPTTQLVQAAIQLIS